MARRLAWLVLAAAVCLAQPSWSQTIGITLDKTEPLRFDQPVSTVLIGNPEIVAVAVDSVRLVFLTGKQVGETNLLVLDRRGNEIVRYDVVVAPELDRHVTIHRGTDSPATMSCDPRCVGVAGPDTGDGRRAAPKAAPSAGAADTSAEAGTGDATE